MSVIDERDDLPAHEERAIAAFMARLAGTVDAPGATADPAALWWKAQLLRRWDAERVASRPLDVIEPLEIAGGLIAAGLLLFWTLPSLETLIPPIPGLR
jgi:hypothetical protein